LSTVGSLGIAGCAGGNSSGEANSGSTPKESGDEDSTDTPTETGYDPQEYYGLPECDGSRPIRLIAVNSDGTGIIQNMRGEDQLVYVTHNDGFTSGDYCGGTIVEGGEQTAYEADSGEPRQIEIGAVEATGRNKDKACSQSGALPDGNYSDGCVDPNTFRGYRDVSSEQSNENEDEVWEDALEAEEGDSEDEGTPEEPIVFSEVKAELDKQGINTPWVKFESRIANNLDEEQKIPHTYTIEGPEETFRHSDSLTLSGQGSDWVSHTMKISEWENVEGDSRAERQESREQLFENSSVYIEYNGQRFEAQKTIS
jgi:hypothetical protein